MSNQLFNQLNDVVLETLSFMEPMNLEKIFLDLDQGFLEENPQLTTQDLLTSIDELIKAKKVKIHNKSGGQNYWIKIFPKRPWYKRFFGS